MSDRRGSNRGNQSYNRNRNYNRSNRSGRGNYNRDNRSSKGRGGGYNRNKNKRSGRKSFFLPRGTVIYVLDVLENGHPNRNYGKTQPIIQAMEAPGFNLFEMSYYPDKGVKIQEKIVITNTPDSKVGKVLRRLRYHDLTQTSKELLQSTIELHLEDDQQKYIDFINNAGSITTKRHTLSLIPGVGQKLMWSILNERENKPFESFEDLNKRVNIKSIKTLLAKRILNEIIDDEQKHYLFVRRKKMSQAKKKSSGMQY
ncbi:MAG: DUF655 domain-containing protein [Promethearchaeota archaeon]